ncbi:hypothetical protein [Mesorhizobium sp. STM 4661]|uniref:hypothetical protein n=1 Tax=Mesorhizobium sp. STM 4661 TaxID=1297570 RepID=UPI0002BFA8D7|nr:hypothetical protein [Mesorhizobium sp. STM 4661]CCV16549.1 hypothetical protein MESS4_p40067 [Mesorhizobium sp. STM 4661]
MAEASHGNGIKDGLDFDAIESAVRVTAVHDSYNEVQPGAANHMMLARRRSHAQ